MKLFDILKSKFPRIKKDEPLKNHCTFRVGGPADLFYELFNIEEIPALIALAGKNSLPYLLIGRGSNALFRDSGFRGLVIKNLTNAAMIDGERVKAVSGTLLATVIQKCVEANLTGLEPLYGLPGSIGGAVYGNAGVPGIEIGNFVEQVSVFNIEEGIHKHEREDLGFEYRESMFKGKNPPSLRSCVNEDIIMEIILRLKRGNHVQSKEAMKVVDMIRRAKQPQGYTCGSFFKNPSPEAPAGKLIDQCGLKGMTMGGAKISEKHGNFFMNMGNARATDILQLAALAKEKVRVQFGIKLEEEVRIFNES